MILLMVAIVAATPVRAEEGGFFGFLSGLTGGGGEASAPAPVQAPAPSQGEQVRPLTVRPAHKRPTASRAAHMVRLPGRTGPVSIYHDPTLRDGDAVMTKDGMKVFAGGRFSPDHPYDDADFVAVSASKVVAPSLKKTVIELNKLPHG